jgi:outer membrane protein
MRQRNGCALVTVAVLAFSAPASAQSVATFQDGGPGARQAAAPAATAFPADSRIGYVDLDRVAALSNEGKAAAVQLQDLRSKKAAEAAARSKQVELLQQKVSAGSAVLSEAAFTRLQREFQRAQIDFQRFNEDAQAEVEDTQQQLLRAFSARLFPVVGQVATEKNLWAVFRSDSALMWHLPAIDLSEEVAKRLDSAAAPKR